MPRDKMKLFRQILIGYGLVSIILLFAFRYQPSLMNPVTMVLIFSPVLIGVMVYYLLQMRMDIKRNVGIKLVLLGSFSRMGYLIGFGLLIAGGLLEASNDKRSSALRNSALVVFALIIVASYMYQAGMRKWIAEQNETRSRQASPIATEDSSEDNLPDSKG